MLIDIVLEIIKSVVMIIFVAYLWRCGRGQGLRHQAGWQLIFIGFALILIGSLFDITDEFESLNRFVIVGDTVAQAFFEKLLGSSLGFVLLAIGFVKWLPHLAERERVREELKEAHQELETRVAERTAELVRASNAKSEFLSNMSHELRTPLNSVIGFTNVLLKKKGERLGEKEFEYLERVRGNGMHLLSLINQLLDLSKVESGHMEPVPSAVSLAELVPDTVNQLGQEFSQRGVKLTTELPDSLSPLHTDEGMLKQILLNLIGNALKFTEEGAVIVRVHADPESGRPTRIEVTDTGIGIPHEQLDSIFEAFQQVDAGTERSFAGTGLGLTITKALCAKLGFDISVESEVGKGTRFSIGLAPDGAGRPDPPVGPPG